MNSLVLNSMLVVLLMLMLTFEKIRISAGGNVGMSSVNLTQFRAHRQRRGLIFTNGGTIKVNDNVYNSNNYN